VTKRISIRALLVASMSAVVSCSGGAADDPAEAPGSGGGGGAAGFAGTAGAGPLPHRDQRRASLPNGDGSCSPFAIRATEHDFGPGQNTGQAVFPDPVLGAPRGGGCCKGSLDVVSLGNGGSVTLELGARIVDEAGPDFIVFENAFFAGGDESQPFAELATVEVSENGETWTEFPCTAAAAPYGTCAGWHPVYANVDENDIDPLDPSVAGGDAFDLADIGVDSARYVRITDRVDLVGMNGVFDLDAVAAVHSECP
jgi:hypothetical protein